MMNFFAYIPDSLVSRPAVVLAARQIDDAIRIFDAGHDAIVLREELGLVPAERTAMHDGHDEVGD